MDFPDSAGSVQHCELACSAVDMSGYDLILGYDWLRAVNPLIYWSQPQWYYGGQAERIRVEEISADTCANMALKGSAMYIVWPQAILPNSIRDFADVFNIRSMTMRLTSYRGSSPRTERLIFVKEGTRGAERIPSGKYRERLDSIL